MVYIPNIEMTSTPEYLFSLWKRVGYGIELTKHDRAALMILVGKELKRVTGHRPIGSLTTCKRNVEIAKKYNERVTPSNSDSVVSELAAEYELRPSTIWRAIREGRNYVDPIEHLMRLGNAKQSLSEKVSP